MKAVFVALCLLFLMPGELHARWCYVCGPLTTGSCADEYKPSATPAHRQQCGVGEDKCMKIDSGLAVSRSCSSGCVPVGVGEIGTFCCEKDDCNSGTKLGSSLLLLLLPLISIFVGKYVF